MPGPYYIEVIWNREFDWRGWDSPYEDKENAVSKLKALMDAGDGASVKDGRVVNAFGKVVFANGKYVSEAYTEPPKKIVETGGAAFPNFWMEGSQQYANSGMTLRQWYAGQAIAGLMQCGRDCAIERAQDRCRKFYVESAFAIADAMIEFEAKES